MNPSQQHSSLEEDVDESDIIECLQFVNDEWDGNIVSPSVINTEGLRYLAGYVAHRYLGTTTNEDNPVP